MNSTRKTTKKVILLGHFGVGKTSLVRRFVHQKFSDEYLTTIGVKVDKKTIEISNGELTMIIWDIEGGAVQNRLPKAYFLGAHGIIFVFDLLRTATYENMDEELSFFKDLLPQAKMKIVGNKLDLMGPTELTAFQAQYEGRYDFLTSAKTGDHVEEMFSELGISMMS